MCKYKESRSVRLSHFNVNEDMLRNAAASKCTRCCLRCWPPELRSERACGRSDTAAAGRIRTATTSLSSVRTATTSLSSVRPNQEKPNPQDSAAGAKAVPGRSTNDSYSGPPGQEQLGRGASYGQLHAPVATAAAQADLAEQSEIASGACQPQMAAANEHACPSEQPHDANSQPDSLIRAADEQDQPSKEPLKPLPSKFHVLKEPAEAAAPGATRRAIKMPNSNTKLTSSMRQTGPCTRSKRAISGEPADQSARATQDAAHVQAGIRQRGLVLADKDSCHEDAATTPAAKRVCSLRFQKDPEQSASPAKPRAGMKIPYGLPGKGLKPAVRAKQSGSQRTRQGHGSDAVLAEPSGSPEAPSGSPRKMPAGVSPAKRACSLAATAGPPAKRACSLVAKPGQMRASQVQTADRLEALGNLPGRNLDMAPLNQHVHKPAANNSTQQGHQRKHRSMPAGSLPVPSGLPGKGLHPAKNCKAPAQMSQLLQEEPWSLPSSRVMLMLLLQHAVCLFFQLIFEIEIACGMSWG